MHDVTCFNFNIYSLMKRLLGKQVFKSFVFAQTVSFLVLFEEVGSRKKDGLDCMITLLCSDIILCQQVATFVNLHAPSPCVLAGVSDSCGLCLIMIFMRERACVHSFTHSIIPSVSVQIRRLRLIQMDVF